MKLEEAKNKICPFIVDCSKQDSSYACGYGEVPVNIKCIASECMAWGWGKEYLGEPNMFGIYKDVKTSTTEGYCMRLVK